MTDNTFLGQGKKASIPLSIGGRSPAFTRLSVPSFAPILSNREGGGARERGTSEPPSRLSPERDDRVENESLASGQSNKKKRDRNDASPSTREIVAEGQGDDLGSHIARFLHVPTHPLPNAVVDAPQLLHGPSNGQSMEEVNSRIKKFIQENDPVITKDFVEIQPLFRDNPGYDGERPHALRKRGDRDHLHMYLHTPTQSLVSTINTARLKRGNKSRIATLVMKELSDDYFWVSMRFYEKNESQANLRPFFAYTNAARESTGGGLDRQRESESLSKWFVVLVGRKIS